MTRILIVDDNTANLSFLRTMLEGHGYTVDEARHGAEALTKARDNPPDMIISDLLMPVMDGYTLLRQWKSDPLLNTHPFIVYTATYTDPRDERLALDLGADAFILKPMEPEDFLSRLREVQANMTAAVPTMPKTQSIDDEIVLKTYSETLIRKLEKRTLQLEEANRALQKDIADRARAEQKLRESEERLRQSQKMEAIGQLAAGVAHDFNNILAAILGNVQLALADTSEDHPARVSLEEIKKSSMRAKNLVQQILAFSRHQPLERQVIELGPTFKEASNFLRATIPSAIELVFSMDRATPLVLADSTQVYQVIANLCTNAWHALEDRPGRIEVKLEPVALDAVATDRLVGLGPGRFACLSVTDNGKGMDSTTLERAFEPFFTTKEPGKGSGLGLSVVHGIVKGHEGAITVKSQPGGGTTFQVYFPEATAPAKTVTPTPVTPLRGEGQNILYLDDEESLVFLATRMLERLGYRLSGFTRTEDAMKAFRANPRQFDLAIVDLNMPGASGTQVAANLLKLRSDLPIVLCSGHVTEELRQSARNVGIREVLYKPTTMEEFSEAIHHLTAKIKK